MLNRIVRLVHLNLIILVLGVLIDAGAKGR
jgi:hypothetical protein